MVAPPWARMGALAAHAVGVVAIAGSHDPHLYQRPLEVPPPFFHNVRQGGALRVAIGVGSPDFDDVPLNWSKKSGSASESYQNPGIAEQGE